MLVAFIFEVLPRQTAQNSSLRRKWPTGAERTQDKPATAETTELSERPVHIEHSDVMLFVSNQRILQICRKAMQKPETAHPDKAKGAKRHTWHSRNATTNNIPSARCSAKCPHRKFPDLGSPSTNGPDIQWTRNLSLLTHELRYASRSKWLQNCSKWTGTH